MAFAACLVAMLFSRMAATPVKYEEEAREMFEHFKRKYSKTYTEEEIRFESFKKSLAAIAELNTNEGVDCEWSRNSNALLSSSGDSCPYGITPFSDMHKDEFKAKMLGFVPSNKTNRGLRTMNPAEYASGWSVSKKDWRSEGKVSPMKDQNPCGVCWAFSAASTVESAYAIKYGGNPPILSPEQIVECDGTHHCNDHTSGGNYEQAWHYLQQHGGLATESAYPTTCCDETRSPKIGTCKKKAAKVKVAGVSDGPRDEKALAAAVASQGPFSIAVAAEAWQHWTGGTKIMTQCAGSVDHAVSIVGFDMSGSTPYWIVRNQWGTHWGHNGYIYLAMGHNTCKLTTEPAIAKVAAASDEEVVV
jgi:C1A family cysteine protease